MSYSCFGFGEFRGFLGGLGLREEGTQVWSGNGDKEGTLDCLVFILWICGRERVAAGFGSAMAGFGDAISIGSDNAAWGSSGTEYGSGVRCRRSQLVQCEVSVR